MLVLVAVDPGHDWPLGNWMALGDAWRAEVRTMLGRDVSLEGFSRLGEKQKAKETKARAPAILLWARTAPLRP